MKKMERLYLRIQSRFRDYAAEEQKKKEDQQKKVVTKPVGQNLIRGERFR